MFLGSLREVGVVGQTAEQRRHLRSRVHLLLWGGGRETVSIKNKTGIADADEGVEGSQTSNKAKFLS